MIAKVPYTVPVTAVVNTETNAVERVVVHGGMIELDVEAHDVFDAEDREVTDDEQLTRIIDIAEASEWPVWSHDG